MRLNHGVRPSAGSIACNSSRSTAFALQFGRRYKLLDAVEPHAVGKLRIAELGRTDPFLLLLDPAATLQGEAHGPFEAVVGYRLGGGPG